MENELIYRGDIFQRLCEYCSRMKYCDKKGCIDAEIINSIPAVDAVEVRHGRWEGNYPQAMFRLKRCSACETLAPVGWYCFFCGAKMDGEDNST